MSMMRKSRSSCTNDASAGVRRRTNTSEVATTMRETMEPIFSGVSQINKKNPQNAVSPVMGND